MPMEAEPWRRRQRPAWRRILDRRRHKLYADAFEQWRDKARVLGVTLKALVKSEGTGGQVLRRGTPGAFGFNLRPTRGAWHDRRGYNAPGNSRDRRFARRHPNHFAPIEP